MLSINKYYLNHGLISILSRVVSMPLAVLFNIMLARSLSSNDYGVVGLMIQILAYLQTISLFGYREIILKKIPAYFKNKDFGKIIDILFSAIIISVSLSLFFGFILNLFKNQMSELYDEPKIKIVLPYFFFLLLIMVLVFISNTFLISLKRVWQANVSERTVMNVVNTILLSLLLYYEVDIDLKVVFLVLILGRLGSLSFSLFFSLKKIDFFKMKRPKIWMNSVQSFHFVFSDVTLKLVATVSPIILGIYLNSSDIAYFYTAFMLANLTSFTISMSNNLISNKISNLYNENNFLDILKINTKFSKILSLLGFCFFICFIILGQLILSFWGSEYSENSYYLLIILSIGEVVNCYGGTSGLIISVCGMEKKGLKIAFMSSLFNLTIQFLFIYLYGLIGAAIATSLSVMIYNFLKLNLIKSNLKIIG